MNNQSMGILSMLMLVLSGIWIIVVVVAQFLIFSSLGASSVDQTNNSDLSMFMGEMQTVLLYEIIILIVSMIIFKVLKSCIKRGM